MPPQLLAVRRPLHALHPRRSRRRPRMASSWRIWPARILLLWLRRPRRHRRHAAIAAVASPAIGAGARSPSAHFRTRNAPTASAALTPRAGYRTAALAATSSSRARQRPRHHRYHHDAGCRRHVRAATAMLLPAPVAPRLPPCGSHSRTDGAFLCCSRHFASSLADSRGAPE